MSYTNPTIETIPNPQGLDKAIERLQIALSTVPWLEKVFGRAQRQVSPPENKIEDGKIRNNRNVIKPEVYYNGEPYDARPNDNLSASAFFFARDPLTFLDYEPFNMLNNVSQPLSLIVWANLNRIDSTKSYNFGDELRRDVLLALRNVDSFRLEESYMQPDHVFDPFTMDGNYQTYMKPPFTAFRIDGLLYYSYLTGDC